VPQCPIAGDANECSMVSILLSFQDIITGRTTDGPIMASIAYLAINPLQCKSSTSNNMKLVRRPLYDEWAVTFGTARRGRNLVGCCGPAQSSHTSTASVPITVLLYNDPLLRGFSVPVKGLRWARNNLSGNTWRNERKSANTRFQTFKVNQQAFIRCSQIFKSSFICDISE